jgi:hypothetical protein
LNPLRLKRINEDERRQIDPGELGARTRLHLSDRGRRKRRLIYNNLHGGVAPKHETAKSAILRRSESFV